jgi:hypothetical protein
VEFLECFSLPCPCGIQVLVHLTQGETQSLADGYSDIYRDLIDGIAAGVVATAGQWLLRVLQVAEAGALAVVTAVLNAEYDQIKTTANKAMDKGQIDADNCLSQRPPGLRIVCTRVAREVLF